MTAPTRIQLSRKKGWRLPPNTVVVSRPSMWGNPFKVGRDGTAQECVDKYQQNIGLLTYSIVQSLIVQRLRGKNLACWCPLDKPCHADVLLEIANLKQKG